MSGFSGRGRYTREKCPKHPEGKGHHYLYSYTGKVCTVRKCRHCGKVTWNKHSSTGTLDQVREDLRTFYQTFWLDNQVGPLLKRVSSVKSGTRRIQYWIDWREKHLGKISYLIEVIDLKSGKSEQQVCYDTAEADVRWRAEVSKNGS